MRSIIKKTKGEARSEKLIKRKRAAIGSMSKQYRKEEISRFYQGVPNVLKPVIKFKKDR